MNNRIPLYPANWKSENFVIISNAAITKETAAAILVEQTVKFECTAEHLENLRIALRKMSIDHGIIVKNNVACFVAWLPISQIEIVEKNGDATKKNVVLPEWITKEKALCYAPEMKK